MSKKSLLPLPRATSRSKWKGNIVFRSGKLPIAAALATAFLTQANADPPTVFQVVEEPAGPVFAAPKELNNGAGQLHSFVHHGVLYPAGTIVDGRNGFSASGQPVFADKVIGTWLASGWYISDGMQASKGLRISTVQVFHFTSGETLVTRGVEIVGQPSATRNTILHISGFNIGGTAWLRQNTQWAVEPSEMTFEIVDSDKGF
ncbi:hypothetical protein [Ruegeria arenilitoris]|uniref:hypothetical protein n=1 Tax=Ruegeria arenilitoris TaxID=1173585 RepID=UPI001C2C1369|nr:hypothetical protein [Ruegeria arenilitoris]